jgi:energy-coupling factor transporter transmembrane protein EcfT
MDSRAFGAYPKRTSVDEFRWSRSGLWLVGVFAALEGALIAAAALTGGLLERYSAGML